MWNRHRLTADVSSLIARYSVSPLGKHERLPPPDIFPKKPAYIIRGTDAGHHLDVMLWGFPHNVTCKTDKKVEKPVTNVRNLSSPFWRSALATPARRCLVPATSFSEYGPGVPGKLPLHWFDVPSVPILSLAGIWRPLGDGAVFAFLTCEPNILVAPIHPKAMPVILHVDDEERWLSADLDEALALVAPFPSQLMTIAWPFRLTRRSVYVLHMGDRHLPRIWPQSVQTVGQMRDLDALVAAFCRKCRKAFRVDLEAIIHAKGRSYSLIDKQGPCRLLDCDGRAFFMYSPGIGVPYRPLTTDAGDSAREAAPSPPDDDPPPCAPPPRAPAGVSPTAWAAADARERARLLRKARG